MSLTTLNVSDWAAAEAASSHSRHASLSQPSDPRQLIAGIETTDGPLDCRKLLQGIDVFYVDVWLSILPAGNSTALVWNKLSSPDARLWEATKKWGYPMNISFVNATTYKVG